MKSKAKMIVLVQDKYNHQKTWEISYLSGNSYYLRQMICGKQHGRGQRVTKGWLSQLGILDMKPIRITVSM